MSHYQGKLRTSGRHLFDDGGRVVATVVSGEGYNLMDNNCRLVACWNACDGIPTEEIESGTAGFLHRYATVVDERDALVKERDELVAVIRSAQKAFEQGIKSDFSNILAKYPEAS